jgi:hypothetical protein
MSAAAGNEIDVTNGYALVGSIYQPLVELEEGITGSFYGRAMHSSQHEESHPHVERQDANFAKGMYPSGNTVVAMMWIGAGIRMNPSVQECEVNEKLYAPRQGQAAVLPVAVLTQCVTLVSSGLCDTLEPSVGELSLKQRKVNIKEEK